MIVQDNLAEFFVWIDDGTVSNVPDLLVLRDKLGYQVPQTSDRQVVAALAASKVPVRLVTTRYSCS
jgi:hypothetical protein